MKKLVALTLSLLLLATCFSISAFAEEAGTETTETESKFEQVMLKKGNLIVKEFIDCCMFEKDEYFDSSHTSKWFGFTDTLQFQTASILDVETGIKVYALRITTGYYKSDYSYGEAVGVMDADEIDGAIQALKYIKQHANELKDYSEVVYTASSGMEVGAYHNSSESRIYVQVNSNASKFYSLDKVDSLIQAFETVSATLGN